MFRRLRFKREFKRKCLNTTPCQCCAYWSIRKSRCDLEVALKKKYKIKE